MIEVDIVHRLGAMTLQLQFTAEARVVGVFGPSGAGKSTLLDAVAGMLVPERGRICVQGKVLTDRSRGIALAPEARQVGYVFQDGLLFPHLSVEANLLYGHRRRRGVAPGIDPGQVIALLGLQDLLQRRPGTLSGGEKQRVAIGRALLAQPRILLMDEPLAALDAARKDEILACIERLRDALAIPILYVSHAVEEVARIADVVVIVEAGKVRAVGPPSATLGASGAGDAGNVPGAVLEAVVAGHDPADALTRLAFDGGALWVPQVAAAVGQRLRVFVHARDVALALHRPEAISMLNVLPACVEGVEAQAGHAVHVDLRLGAARLRAQVTRRSAEAMRLRAGLPVFALLKAVSVQAR